MSPAWKENNPIAISLRLKKISLMLITHSFSESELGTLMANYNLINDAFQLLEKSVNFLKITIDAYNEAMD